MLTRLPYIGLLILSFPAIVWNYFTLANAARDGSKIDVWLSMGGACGIILALIALYGLFTGKPFANLSKAVKLLTLGTAVVVSPIAASYLLFLILAFSWR